MAGRCNGIRPTLISYLFISSLGCSDHAGVLMQCFLFSPVQIQCDLASNHSRAGAFKVTMLDPLVFGQTDQCDGNGEHHHSVIISWGSLALLLWSQEAF